METVKIFLASSSELVEDRRAFEIFLNRRNKILIKEGIFLELVVWEDFLDFMSKTRLQDQYNEALKDCDLFAMLFHTKVGMYTHEEFDTAYRQFQETGKPLILTYFKDALDGVNADTSLESFKKHLGDLGHFFTSYKNIEGLQLHFMEQLEKLEQKGFFNKEGNSNQPNASAPSSAPSKDSLVKTIKNKVAKGDSIEKILKQHREEILAVDEDKGIELTMLEGRSGKLEKDVRIGVISSGDERMERARINAAFLGMLDDLDA